MVALRIDELDFNGQDMQGNFDGDFQIADGQVSAKGAARIEAVDLEPWLMTAGLSFPGRLGAAGPVTRRGQSGSSQLSPMALSTPGPHNVKKR